MGETWNKVWKVISSVDYTDYHVLPFEGKNIDLKPGNIVTVYECEIAMEEDMSCDDFEEFYLEKYSPAFAKHFKGVKFCVLKGDRGERTGKYTELMIADSMDDYSLWFNEKGYSTEKTTKAFTDMGEIQQRMEKMYTWSRTNTYVVL